MKGLSLWQPWSSLCLMIDPETGLAAKSFETRSWATDYRGDLIIHAAKRTAEVESFLKRDHFRDVFKKAGLISWKQLPFGAALGVVTLAGIITTEQARKHISDQERAFGDYSDGRFAWRLENPRPFKTPIPLQGRQGLWDVSDLPLDDAAPYPQSIIEEFREAWGDMLAGRTITWEQMLREIREEEEAEAKVEKKAEPEKPVQLSLF